MFCTNCGKELPEGTMFCTQCGRPVEAAATPGVAPAPQPAAEEASAPGAAPAPQPAAVAPAANPTPAAEPTYTEGSQPAPAYAAPQPAPAPNPVSAPEQPKKKGGKGKIVGIVLGIVVLVAVLGVGGYFVYTNFFATGPEEVIMEDLEAQLADYSDPTTGNGDRLMTEADNVLSGLVAYPSPGADAYEAWLEDSSYTVDGVVVADDGDTATATATVTHAPLIEFVENHEGLADDPGEPQETTLELTYVRDGSSWTADGDELEEAVFTAYLPSDEELIISDVDSYFEADDDMRSGFIAGLESGSGGELDQLGISADEFADAYLDGYGYEVGTVTVDGDTAEVEVTVTIKSYAEIMSTFESNFNAWAESVDPSTITSEDQVYQKAGEMLMEAAQAAEPEAYDATLTFSQDSSGVWWMDSSSEYELMSILGL
ncbi:zinc ribbon domain-containing protein [uncultured Enorma sp.]|uniref:zinc ribbon domain-containing protein n=1 Tax=uncultured Enorma sp. TaxID=1714346 RepID=UPI0025E6E70A|nr:zinc ribbon domain-containing protein [uncultured Enorma sp.]